MVLGSGAPASVASRKLDPRKMVAVRACFAAVAIPVLLAIAIPYLVPVYPVRESGGILITGASSGIGKHAAFSLAKRGFTVFAGVRNAAKGEALAAAASADDKEVAARLRPIVIEVTNDDSVASALAEIRAWVEESGEEFIGLVNNAGVGSGSTVGTLEKDTRRIYEVNVFGLLKVTDAFLPLILEQKSRIVNIGSIAGVWSIKNIAYSSSKFAVEGISDGLRYHLAADGVAVSLVEPAYIASNMCNADVCRAGPEVSTRVITDALVSQRPQARYQCADVNGIPARVVYLIATLLPDVLKDAVGRALS